MAQSTVLVGCDGSPDDDPALRFAADEARTRQAHLVVATGYHRPVDPDLDSFDVADAELEGQAQALVHEAMGRAFAATGIPCPYAVVVAEGDLARVLLNASAEDGVVMIVVGGHNRELRHRLLGRLNSSRFHADRPIPLTVVPQDAVQEPAR